MNPGVAGQKRTCQSWQGSKERERRWQRGPADLLERVPVSLSQRPEAGACGDLRRSRVPLLGPRQDTAARASPVLGVRPLVPCPSQARGRRSRPECLQQPGELSQPNVVATPRPAVGTPGCTAVPVPCPATTELPPGCGCRGLAQPVASFGAPPRSHQPPGSVRVLPLLRTAEGSVNSTGSKRPDLEAFVRLGGPRERPLQPAGSGDGSEAGAWAAVALVPSAPRPVPSLTYNGGGPQVGERVAGEELIVNLGLGF